MLLEMKVKSPLQSLVGFLQNEFDALHKNSVHLNEFLSSGVCIKFGKML
jgi:hypothetical protein